MLIASSLSIYESNPEKSYLIISYSFTYAWLSSTAQTLNFFEQTERNFPHVSLLVRDTFDGRSTYLGFNDYQSLKNDQGEGVEPEKRSYLVPTTLEERG